MSSEKEAKLDQKKSESIILRTTDLGAISALDVEKPSSKKAVAEEEPAWSLSRTITFHVCAVALSIMLWALSSLVPYGPLYDKHGPRVSGIVFALANFPISIAISLPTVFWIRELWGVGIKWWSRETWWPVLAYMVWNSIVYAIFALIPVFPVPFLAIYGGGAAYSVVPPLVIYMFGLSKEIKSRPNFFKKFASSIIISGSLNVYWFLLFGFYMWFISMRQSTGLQILVLAVIKLFTMVFMGIEIKLVHAVAHSLGHAEGENIGALAKLLTESAFETYIFLVLPDMHDWTVFGFWLALDLTCLTVELLHHYESVLDIVLAQFRTLSKSATDLHSASDREQTIRVRVKHYLAAILAKVFGTMVFTTLIIAWCWGPNKAWYPIFASFSPAVIHDAIMKAWIALPIILLHCVLSLLFVRFRWGSDVSKFARQFFGRYWPLFVAIYLAAPVFPFTHMGKHWYCIEYMWTVVYGNFYSH